MKNRKRWSHDIRNVQLLHASCVGRLMFSLICKHAAVQNFSFFFFFTPNKIDCLQNTLLRTLQYHVKIFFKLHIVVANCSWAPPPPPSTPPPPPQKTTVCRSVLLNHIKRRVNYSSTCTWKWYQPLTLFPPSEMTVITGAEYSPAPFKHVHTLNSQHHN